MMPLPRSNAPAFLDQHWEEWGRQWQIKLANNSKASFTYPRVNNQGLEQIREALFTMSKSHCAFCDEFPIGSQSPETIEHFKPKKLFPLIAYQWENLYPCCMRCQEKGDNFNELLLRPDADDYSFQRYFVINAATMELEPNAGATMEDQERAKTTIKLYKLNRVRLRTSRRLVYEYMSLLLSNNISPDTLPFRYFIEFLL